MAEAVFTVESIGIIRSPLKSLEECPKQYNEGAPDAWIEIEPRFEEALEGLAGGQEILVLTWLHEADRSLLKVHPRGDKSRPARGVFSTRSPDRPNPLGLHRVRIMEIEGGLRLKVRAIEALDGTPVVDIKSVMQECDER